MDIWESVCVCVCSTRNQCISVCNATVWHIYLWMKFDRIGIARWKWPNVHRTAVYQYAYVRVRVCVFGSFLFQTALADVWQSDLRLPKIWEMPYVNAIFAQVFKRCRAFEIHASNGWSNVRRTKKNADERKDRNLCVRCTWVGWRENKRRQTHRCTGIKSLDTRARKRYASIFLFSGSIGVFHIIFCSNYFLVLYSHSNCNGVWWIYFCTMQQPKQIKAKERERATPSASMFVL